MQTKPLKRIDFAKSFDIPLTESAVSAVPDFVLPEGVSPIWIEGAEFNGKPTRFFAWLYIPEKVEKPVSGMVLVHGGDGTAFLYWLNHYRQQGYAVIAMDTVANLPLMDFEGPGCRKPHDYMAGPTDKNIFNNNIPYQDSWPFHAVSAVIRANSLLRSFPEVDPDKIGITGISWGGFLTCIANAIDLRFAASVPVYGCGYLKNLSRWSNPQAAVDPGDVDPWLAVWDPMYYLPEIKNPILFVSDPADPAYWQPAWMRSTLLPAGEVSRASLVNIRHSHTDGMQLVVERFLHCYLQRDQQDWPQISEKVSADGSLQLIWSKRMAKQATLVYTLDTGVAPEREWQCSNLAITPGVSQTNVELPEGTQSAFVNLDFGEDIILSSVDLVTLSQK